MSGLHSAVRRLLTSYFLVGSVEWLMAVALSTAVYDRTGSTAWVAAGVAVRFVPSVLIAPIAGVLADRVDRRRVMIWSCAARAAGVLTLALAAAASAPPAVLVGLAVVDTILLTPYRPAAFALLPSLAGAEDLPRANGAMGVILQATWIAGPALGALAAIVVSPAFAFLLASFGLVGAALCAGGIRGDTAPGAVNVEMPRSPSEMLRDGVTALRSAPGALGLVVAMVGVEFLFGFELVAQVSVAAERLGIGAGGAGWMTAFAGIGGLLGAPLAARAAAGHRAGLGLAVAAGGFGAALAVLAALTSPALAFAVLVLEGVANVLYDVLTLTLLQRLLSGGLLARGQALTDSLNAVALTCGSLAAPFLINGLGLQGALVAVGLLLVVVAAALVAPLVSVDRETAARVGSLAPVVERFRATALLALAPYATVERLAAAAITLVAPPGTVIVREGDVADCLYIIDRGRLTVSMAVGSSNRLVTELGANDWFGEIGVVRNVRRTATVTAVDEARVWRIPAGELLAAVDHTVGVADPLRRGVSGRLARTHPYLLAEASLTARPPSRDRPHQVAMQSDRRSLPPPRPDQG